MRTTLILTTLALLITAQFAFAAGPEPVRRIPISVPPYYTAGRTPDERAKVEVSRVFNHALASTTAPDIVQARDALVAQPASVTPMTMTVLAIRLYDVGMRDDAVFWFYAAKARYFTMQDAVDMNAPGLKSVTEAMKAFNTQVAPYINSYAFCDPDKQYALMTKALDWVEKNPYDAALAPNLAAKPGDRKVNLAQSVQRQRAIAADEHAKFKDPKFVADLAKVRKKNKTDAMFCWK